MGELSLDNPAVLYSAAGAAVAFWAYLNGYIGKHRAGGTAAEPAETPSTKNQDAEDLEHLEALVNRGQRLKNKEYTDAIAVISRNFLVKGNDDAKKQ